MEKKYDFPCAVDADDFFCDDPAVLAARERFGIQYLYPWQRLVIANIIDSYQSACGQDGAQKNDGSPELRDDVFCNGRQIVLLPTGAGKSACFQIPALLLDGITLVVYPLLALMSDQERRLSAGGVECAVFRGGQSEDERNDAFEKLKRGAKIIIANPEVLLDFWLLERLCGFSVSHIAIDEAHCVSEWGDSFRPAYLELGKIIEKTGAPVVTAFTATASPEVLRRISDVLFGGNAHIVRSDSDRANIHYYVKKTASKKNAALLLSRTEQRPMIIFCGTRNRAESMAREICTAFGDDAARFYHAGLEKDEKAQIENWFFNAEDAVLCATCAYGMGVDKKNIRTVIHLDAPLTAEAYIQEAGRGGRDGETANAILLWNYEDTRKFKAFKDGSRNAVMRNFALSPLCRRQTLLDALGAEKAVCSGCDVCDEEKRQKARLNWKKSARNSAFQKSIPPFAGHFRQSRFENSPLYFRIPADELMDFSGYIYRRIKNAGCYYTKKSLEEICLRELNAYVRAFTGINIWTHSDFEQALEGLLFENKIQILKFPWRGRIKTVGKIAPCFTLLKPFRRRLLHLLCFLRFLVRRLQLVPAKTVSFLTSSAFLRNLLHKCKNPYTKKRLRQ